MNDESIKNRLMCKDDMGSLSSIAKRKWGRWVPKFQMCQGIEYPGVKWGTIKLEAITQPDMQGIIHR